MTKIEAARAEALDQHLSFWQNDDGEIVDVVRHIRPALGINRQMVAGHSFPASVRVYFPAPTGLDARSGDFLFGVSPPSPVLALMDGTHDLLRAIEPHKTAMTIEQVAELFGVSPETIRRMAALKQIGGAFKFGGS